MHFLKIYNYLDITENMANTAYLAFFFQICRQIIRIVMLLYNNKLKIKSHIAKTALASAFDYVAMLEYLYQNLDQTSVRLGAFSLFLSLLNKSLSIFIKEFSLNVLLNMLTDSFLRYFESMILDYI